MVGAPGRAMENPAPAGAYLCQPAGMAPAWALVWEALAWPALPAVVWDGDSAWARAATAARNPTERKAARMGKLHSVEGLQRLAGRPGSVTSYTARRPSCDKNQQFGAQWGREPAWRGGEE